MDYKAEVAALEQEVRKLMAQIWQALQEGKPAASLLPLADELDSKSALLSRRRGLAAAAAAAAAAEDRAVAPHEREEGKERWAPFQTILELGKEPWHWLARVTGWLHGWQPLQSQDMPDMRHQKGD